MLAIFVLLVHTWLAESCVVISGSMAPALLGQHRAVVCSDCGMLLHVGSQPGSEPLWAEALASCPNCGSAANRLADLPDSPGDGLLVFRGAFAWRTPRRWEPAVFRSSSAGRELLVKRVVGLPGEEIRLVDGNVLVDGKIARKPLAAQRSMAILVNDDRYRSTTAERAGEANGASCWQPRAASDTAWQLRPGDLCHVSNAPGADRGKRELDWIDFRPRRSGRWQAINDHYGYNQSRPILELHPVYELLLRCELRASGAGQLALRASDRDHDYEVQIALPGGTTRLLVDGATMSEGRVPIARLAEGVSCEVSTIDRQFVFALDGEPLFEPLEMLESELREASADEKERDARDTNDSATFSIGASGVDVRVRGAQIFRDIYYTQLPTGYAEDAVESGIWRVGDDELFVLGDNSPLSQDSRVLPNVPISQLIGRPLLVYAPRRAVLWRGRQWNLLDWSRLRLAR
jgi:signal peptidase I